MQSYATKIGNAQAMVGAIKAAPGALQGRGMTDAFVANLEMALNSAVEKNGEQESLKAALKKATAELALHLKQVDQAMSEATKVVKLTLPQSDWARYGITATR
jgi:signal transduction protein with GAF and PtsI domain